MYVYQCGDILYTLHIYVDVGYVLIMLQVTKAMLVFFMNKFKLQHTTFPKSHLDSPINGCLELSMERT